MSEVVAVVVVSNDSYNGDVILYRYPREPFSYLLNKDHIDILNMCNRISDVKHENYIEDILNVRDSGFVKYFESFSDSYILNLLKVRPPYINSEFELSLGCLNFIGFRMNIEYEEPKSHTSHGEDTFQKTNLDVSNKTSHKVNFVFVTKNINSVLSKQLYFELARQMLNLLNHQEQKSLFFSTQKAVLMDIYEDFGTNILHSFPELNHKHDIDVTAYAHKFVEFKKRYIELIYEKCIFANDVRSMFIQLLDNSTDCVNLNFNGLFTINLMKHLPPKLDTKVSSIKSKIKPYETLLFFGSFDYKKNKKNIIGLMQSNLMMAKFIEQCSPFRSLEKIITDEKVDISPNQILAVSYHLVKHGYAKVILPISHISEYAVSESGYRLSEDKKKQVKVFLDYFQTFKVLQDEDINIECIEASITNRICNNFLSTFSKEIDNVRSKIALIMSLFFERISLYRLMEIKSPVFNSNFELVEHVIWLLKNELISEVIAYPISTKCSLLKSERNTCYTPSVSSIQFKNINRRKDFEIYTNEDGSHTDLSIHYNLVKPYLTGYHSEHEICMITQVSKNKLKLIYIKYDDEISIIYKYR